MERAKTRALISILKDSSLYQTMSHEEKNSLLARLEKDYPAIFDAARCEEDEEAEKH